MILNRYIGDKAFYRRVLQIALPVLFQNVITNFVSLLDNVMVGRVGTEQMSGVAIVNQLIFVFNLCIFGAVSGAGIFSAQFHGKGDHEGVRDTFRIKFILVLFITAVSCVLLGFFGEPLTKLFLHEGEDNISLTDTLDYGIRYLRVMLVGLPAFAIMRAYSDTLSSTGETVLPMRASFCAVGINLLFNYFLIYGKCGFPELGVVGAAIATVMSRYVECLIVMLFTHRHPDRYPFVVGAYRSFRIPRELMLQVLRKGVPLMMNETLWSLGVTTLTQAYSIRGIEVVSALNISSTVTNLFNCAYVAFGSAIAIIVGQLLGSGDLEKAVEVDRKLIFASVAACFAVGGVMVALSPIFPRIYNTTDLVRHLAMWFIIIRAILMPINSFCHAAYFTLRSGGKIMITCLFDSVFSWVVMIPAAYLLSRKTGLPIIPLYACVESTEIIKVVVGAVMLKSRIWVVNLVNHNKADI